MVVQERSQAIIYVASLSKPEKWFDLAKITDFLTEGDEKLHWEYVRPDPSLDPISDIDRQVSRIANILRPYWQQIIELFRQETFDQKEKDLEQFMIKWDRERWKKL